MKHLLTILFCGFLASCNTAELCNSDAIVEELHFTKLSDLDQREASLTRNDNEVVLAPGDDDIKNKRIIVCSWDGWGRTSRNCRGFGLCHFSWFPEFKKGKHKYEEFASKIESDFLGRRYMDVLLTSPVPSDYNGEIPSLFIDNDLLGEDEENNVTKSDSVIILKGEYRFNRNLGKFGGYRLRIK